MKLTTTIKPQYTGTTDFFGHPFSRLGILKYICGNRTQSHGIFGNGYVSGRDDENIRVFNIEKRRKKVKVLETPRKLTQKQAHKEGIHTSHCHPVRGAKVIITREVVSKATWIGYYYDIPVMLLKLMGLRVIQGERTFKLVPAKRHR